MNYIHLNNYICFRLTNYRGFAAFIKHIITMHIAFIIIVIGRKDGCVFNVI